MIGCRDIACHCSASTFKRSEMVKFLANLPPSLIGTETCGSAHYWARKLTALGHELP